jgi:hypothetical protein
MTEILIDGYNFEDDVKEIPYIDENIPEWGQLSEQILNENVQLSLPVNFSLFLSDRYIRDIPVIIKDSGDIIFQGFVDKVNKTLREAVFICKSATSVLFNSYLNNSNGAYVIDNAYPSDIIKEVLTLCGLSMNEISYNNALSLHKALDITFSVTASKLNAAEILEKICEVTCAVIYLEDGEFHYMPYNPDSTPSVIEIESEEWVTYPKVSTPPVFGSVYNGIDIKYGSFGYMLNGTENPSRVIDMSTDSPLYTSSIITAQYIYDLYDSLGRASKYQIEGMLRTDIGNMLGKSSYIRWEGKDYKMININKKSNVGVSLIGEALI